MTQAILPNIRLSWKSATRVTLFSYLPVGLADLCGKTRRVSQMRQLRFLPETPSISAKSALFFDQKEKNRAFWGRGKSDREEVIIAYKQSYLRYDSP